MQMGMFEALPMDGSAANATVLSEKLGVEKNLLGTSLVDLLLINVLLTL